jgi:hypothetical protein
MNSRVFFSQSREVLENKYDKKNWRSLKNKKYAPHIIIFGVG